jgi:type III secretory pathway component EscR
MDTTRLDLTPVLTISTVRLANQVAEDVRIRMVTSIVYLATAIIIQVITDALPVQPSWINAQLALLVVALVVSTDISWPTTNAITAWPIATLAPTTQPAVLVTLSMNGTLN